MSISTLINIKYCSKKLSNIAFSVLIMSILTACNDSNTSHPVAMPEPEPTEYSYQVTITNLTYAQPLSPVTVVLHADDKMWMIGTSASNALEKLAEAGDNTDFIGQDSIITSMSDDDVLMPGLSSSITVSTTDTSATHLSVTTMLVNTNDAFSGLTGLELSNLEVDQENSWNLNVYDAGTEANNEAAGTIPGPADGGIGFDEMRNDVNVVTLHPGVVSQDDGLTSSVLTQAHRFDNPAIKLTITRIK